MKLVSKYINTDGKKSHSENLADCSTKWLFFRRYHIKSGNVDYVSAPNHCQLRDCKCSPCMDARKMRELEKLRDLTKGVIKFRHVVLTYGAHREFTKANISACQRMYYNYIRQLNRSGKKYSGMSVIEAKIESDGLCHIHHHIAFFGMSPHFMETARRMAKVVGCSVNTKTVYNVKKKSILDYFARRIAWSGTDKDPKEYEREMLGTQIFHRFGDWGWLSSNLEIYRHNSATKTKEYFMFLVFTCSKSKYSTIPPPEIFNIGFLEQIWLDMT